MASLKWPEALREVRQQCETFGEIWPSVAFRIVGLATGTAVGSELKLGACYFQGVPGVSAMNADVASMNPHVVEGATAMDRFVELLSSWERQEPAELAGWK